MKDFSLDKQKIDKIVKVFQKSFESIIKKTNINENYMEYLSSLLYLKYSKKDYFERIYKERKNYYIGEMIDDSLKNLRYDLRDEHLFSNIQFQNINIFRNTGEENILIQIIESIYSLEKITDSEKDNCKLFVAKAYEIILEKCIKNNDIIMTREFYTPKYITEMMASFVVQKNQEIFDPFCGSGNFLLSASQYPDILISGVEQNLNTYNICMTNLFLHNLENSRIFFPFDPYISDQNFDVILSNPPFSQKGWSEFLDEKESSFVYKNGLHSNAVADFAYTLYMYNHLKPNGKMAIILPHGVLFRKSEESVRKNLVEENYIDAIIGLPENLFYSNRISVVILILAKNKKKKDILFIDASKNYESVKNNNILTDEIQQEIVETYHNRTIKDHFSNVVTLEKIVANNYDLSIKKYIKQKTVEKIRMEKQNVLNELSNLKKETSILEDNINDVLESLGLPKNFIENKKEIKKVGSEISYERIGENIRKFRKEKNYSLTEFCDELEINSRYLTQIELGKVAISLISLCKICDKLEITLEDVLK